MPIQTFFVMLVPAQSAWQLRTTRASAVKTPLTQPLTLVGAALKVQSKKTEALVYHRLQASRPAGVSQDATMV